MTNQSEPTVNIMFSWQTFMPDHRQYKQNSIVLTPHDTVIVVKVPVKAEYMTNSAQILVNSLDATSTRPILTPLGMRYVMDQLEAVLPDIPIKSADFNPDTEDEFSDNSTSEKDEFDTVEDEDDEWK